MPSVTQKLQQLLTNETRTATRSENFKQAAMALVRQGADITVRGDHGEHPTLLHILARSNANGTNNEAMIELIRLNPKILERTDGNKCTTLQALMDEFIFERCSLKTFKQSAMVLARQGANLSLQGIRSARHTLLHILILNNMENNNNEIDELIALNNNVLNFPDGAGRTPVHSLLHHDPKVTVEVLDKLLSPINLHLKNRYDETLLHTACRTGNLPAAKHLVAKGHHLNGLTKDHETLLHCAVKSGNPELIQWLCEQKGININAKDLAGDTALHHVLFNEHRNKLELIKLLVQQGADLTIKNNFGQRASDRAASNGRQDLVPFLYNPKMELFYKIQAMHDYGVVLKNKGVSKGAVAIELARQLRDMADKFFQQAPEDRIFAVFEQKFAALMHSKDQEMSAYRVAWRTIIANIAIALTGVGLLLLAGKALYSKATEGRALCFFQKNKTTSEEKMADIDQAIRLVGKNIPTPSQ